MKVKSAGMPPTYDMYAMRGDFDGVTYFMTTLPLNQCVEQLHIENANEVKSFRERMQRTLDETRAREIFEKYLRSNRLRFFNSLVAVMVPPAGETGGYYEFQAFRDEKDKALPFGLLKVLTDIQRVVVDGQHRLRSLMHAAEYARSSEYDEALGIKDFKIPVVFLAFSDVGGDKFADKYTDIYERVTDKARKVFVDLNQNAKKADKKSLYILDDGDFSAVVARYKIEDDPEFERYTRWHGNGAAMGETDHCRTTIEILNYFVEILLPDGEEEQVSKDFDLSSDQDREQAISTKFLSAQSELFGLSPNEFVNSFFTGLSFLSSWPIKIESVLSGKPELQPAEVSLTLPQKKAIKDLRANSLLGTVVGQKVAFDAIHQSFSHLGMSSARENLDEALRRMNLIDELGLFRRSSPLWQELLVRPGGRMKLTAYDSAKRVLVNLLLLSSKEALASLVESWIVEGDATEDTLMEYESARLALEAAVKG